MFSLQTSHRGTELQLSLISLTCKQVFNSLGSQQANSYSDMESCLLEHLCYNNCFVTWCDYHNFMYVLFAFNCCIYPEFSKCSSWHMMYVHIYQSLHIHLFSILLFVATSTQCTLWKRVRIQGKSLHSTRSDFRVGLLWILRMWTSQDAMLGGAATYLSHP